MAARIIATACILCLMAFRGADGEQWWLVQQDSSVAITGASNVNTFTCDAPRYQGRDTLFIRRATNNQAVFVKGRVQLQVVQFDCHNRIMTHDFRKALHAEQHPYIVIHFLSLDRYPTLQVGCESMAAQVRITLAGATKPFTLPCRMEADAKGITHLYGDKTLAFSDFGLQPPSKMMGLIQVHDQLEVSFHLQLQ